MGRTIDIRFFKVFLCGIADIVFIKKAKSVSMKLSGFYGNTDLRRVFLLNHADCSAYTCKFAVNIREKTCIFFRYAV